MQKPDFVPENETHEFLSDFGTQAYHQIAARRTDLIVVNNNNKRESVD